MKLFENKVIILLICFNTVLAIKADQYSKAFDSFHAGNYKDAEKLLERFKPDTEKKDKEKSLLYCKILFIHGNYKAVAEYAAKMLKKIPDFKEMELMLAKEKVAVGNYKDARNSLIKLTRKYPKFWDAHISLIELAEIINDRYVLKREESLFFRLYGNNRIKSVEGLVAAARAVQTADPKGAWRVYSEAEELDKKYLKTYVCAGELAAKKYAWGKAARNFQKALKVNPNYVDALSAFAVLRITEHALHQARKLIDQALNLNPRYVPALTAKASVYLLSKQYDEALTTIQKALAVNPNYPEALAVLATYYDAKKMDEKRAAVIKKATAISPGSPLIFLVMSKFAKLRYDFNTSTKWARKAYEIAPENWEGYYLAGMNLLRLGEENEGYKLLSKSFNMNNYNVWAYNMLLVLDKEFNGDDFTTYETEHFVVKMTRKDGEKNWEKIKPFLENMYKKYSQKYGIVPRGSEQYKRKILILILPNHNYFSARTLGMPGTGAAGICFGQVLALPAPQEGDEVTDGLSWQELIIHEFLHVITLQKTNYLIPRWFTEGISTYEENHAFNENVLLLFVNSYDNKLLLDVDKMEVGFTQPAYPGQVMVSYLHAQVVCEYLVQQYGEGIFKEMMTMFKEGKKTPEVLEVVTNKKIADLNKEIREYTKTLVEAIKNKLEKQKQNE